MLHIVDIEFYSGCFADHFLQQFGSFYPHYSLLFRVIVLVLVLFTIVVIIIIVIIIIIIVVINKVLNGIVENCQAAFDAIAVAVVVIVTTRSMIVTAGA